MPTLYARSFGMTALSQWFPDSSPSLQILLGRPPLLPFSSRGGGSNLESPAFPRFPDPLPLRAPFTVAAPAPLQPRGLRSSHPGARAPPPRAPRPPTPPPSPRPRPSPQPEAPPTPRHLGQPPPAPALGRSVQGPAESPQQRLRKAFEGRAGRSGERRPRRRGRRRLQGRGRRGLQQLPAQRPVRRRRPRDLRGSPRPHRWPRLQRTFRSPPRSPRRRGGRGGRTNPATLHRTLRRKLRSPPSRDRFAWGSRAGGPRLLRRGGGASGGAGRPAGPRVSFPFPAAVAHSRRRAFRSRGGGVWAEQEGLGGCSWWRKRWRSYARAAPNRLGCLRRRGFPRPWEEDCLTPETGARGSPSPAPRRAELTQ